jgi:hypothetical protein
MLRVCLRKEIGDLGDLKVSEKRSSLFDWNWHSSLQFFEAVVDQGIRIIDAQRNHRETPERTRR